MNKFENTNFDEDAQSWYDATGVNFYADGFMSAVCGRKQIDVVKIDKALQQKYDYENSDSCVKCSMKKFVTLTFGKDIAFLLDKWTQIPE